MFLAAVMTVAVYHTALGAPAYVARDATGANDGTSWANAYTNLQTALTDNWLYSEFWLKSGVYTGNYSLAESQRIYGGFAGTETARVQRNWTNRLTIVDGNGGRAFTMGNFCTIDGLVITNCSDSAISISQKSSVRVENCTLADTWGAAALNAERPGPGPSIVRGCTFRDNRGGGIDYFGRTNGYGTPPFLLTVDRCVFLRNSRANGGAIYAFWTSEWLEICNCIFAWNTAAQGGAIYASPNDSTYMPVHNCTFYQNTASNDLGHAIYLNTGYEGPNGKMDLRNSIVWGSPSNQIHIAYAGWSYPELKVAHCDLQNGTNSIVRFVLSKGYGTITDLGGNITNAPSFFHAAGGDFYLNPGSPCIDAGTNAVMDEALFDLTGAPRPIGDGYDIGAYEYGSRPGPPTGVMLFVL